MDSLITREGNKAVLQAAGDIVAATVPNMRLQLRALVQDGVRDLVFDLGQTRMVDSTGIGLLMATYNSVSSAGGTLSVTNASEQIRELFAAMRLNQHLTVVDA